MSAPPEVEVVVPLFGVDWLEDEIEAYADSEVEDEGRSRVYYVTGRSPEELAEFLHQMLAKTATTGDFTVEVKRGKVYLKATTAEPWLQAAGSMFPSGYASAVNDLCRQVSEDPAWAAWWAKSPYGQLLFQQSTSGGPARCRAVPINGDLVVGVDIPQLREMGLRPSRQRATEEAKTNVTAVLTKAAEWLGIPAPEGTTSVGP